MADLTFDDVASSSQPIGIECDHCIRRVLVDAATIKAKRGDKRPLTESGLRCRQCSSREFTATRFHSRSRLKAFMRNL